MPRINNNTFYLNALKKHKHTPKALNWKNKHSQIARFEAIFIMIKPFLSENTHLVDAGCGFGDFYLYLTEQGISPKYEGIEIVPKFANIAKERTQQPIHILDILTDPILEADIYVASGSLNILTRFETYLFIRRCFESSSIGFVFNILKGKNQDENFNLFTKEEMLEFTRSLGAKVTLSEGYLTGDFTLFLQK